MTCHKEPSHTPEIYEFNEHDEDFFGSVVCPSFEAVCGNAACLNNCFGRGTCEASVCTCEDTWTGADCNTRCHESCLTCDSTGCLSCGEGWTFDEVEFTCTCEGKYQDGSECHAECPDGTVENEEGTACHVSAEAALSYSFETAETLGYLAATFAGSCLPMVLPGRGAYFAGNGNSVTVEGLELAQEFTAELWINPAGAGTIFSFVVNRGLYNGNFWVADCFGLVLDYGLS